jgi:hypothetical protein
VTVYPGVSSTDEEKVRMTEASAPAMGGSNAIDVLSKEPTVGDWDTGVGSTGPLRACVEMVSAGVFLARPVSGREMPMVNGTAKEIPPGIFEGIVSNTVSESSWDVLDHDAYTILYSGVDATSPKVWF